MGRTEVLVVGAGHNGLVAAILAADAGRKVTLLERASHPGGATSGGALFPPHPALLNRYAYLVALLPEDLMGRLGIGFPLVSRAITAHAAVRRDGVPHGLIVERFPGAATEESFRALTGSGEDYGAWQTLAAQLRTLAGVVAPRLSGPLARRSEVRDAAVAAAGSQIWQDVVEEPVGGMLLRRFQDDTVRGLVATDALVGTHVSLFDPNLLANRTFLHHTIGRGTGEWLVPVGGMGALVEALFDRARQLGVDIRFGVEVVEAAEDEESVTALARDADGNEQEWDCDHLLAAVAPATVDAWMLRPLTLPLGAQLKINLLLERLPRLASGLDPATAFAGTTHVEQSLWDLEGAYATTMEGQLPTALPTEVFCHSLTDSSVLHGFSGVTMTVFALHTPATLFVADPAGQRLRAAEAALGALQQQLAEPLIECLARDEHGAPCMEIISPLDLQDDLGMPGGHIFHGDLSWPWLEDDEPAETVAQRYGVAVPGCTRILLAGAGTRRGGGVSGLGGAAAVDALLHMN